MIDDVSTIGDAILHIRALTGRDLSDWEFMDKVVAYTLPLYAVATDGRKVVEHSRDENGRLVVSPAPDCQTQYVCLLQDEIYQLSRGGSAITDLPAWTHGQPPFIPWGDVLKVRQAFHRVVHPTDRDWGIEKGEWMGQSEKYFFDRPVGVKRLDQLRVPLHTLHALVRLMSIRDVAEPTVVALSRDVAISAVTMPSEHDVTTPQPVRLAAPKGITRQQVLLAFDGLAPVDLGRCLSNGAPRLFGDAGARVSRGSRGNKHKAAWDPVVMAVGLNETYRVPRTKLNKPFSDYAWLLPWRDQWQEVYPDLR